MTILLRRYHVLLVVLIVTAVTTRSVASSAAVMEHTETIVLRGHRQALHVYGTRGGTPVIVTSGDGGWMHLGPHVAEFLAARGCFVIGVDARAYLESFTSGSSTLRPEDEPSDYQALARYAAQGTTERPLLVGVSVGAGLSVLAAADGATKPLIAGVVGLGLPDINELGWRWKDSLIYLTHGVPNEPTFSAAALVDRVSPVPLAAIHSTRDEFMPVGRIREIVARARPPARLWTIDAADHRFSDRLVEFDRQLIEAMAWVRENQPRGSV